MRKCGGDRSEVFDAKTKGKERSVSASETDDQLSGKSRESQTGVRKQFPRLSLVKRDQLSQRYVTRITAQMQDFLLSGGLCV